VTPDIVSEIDTDHDHDVGYHPILYPILTPIIMVRYRLMQSPISGIPIMVPTLTPISGMQCTISAHGDRMTRYRRRGVLVPDISVNFEYRVSM
jgi:hypothetical protein